MSYQFSSAGAFSLRFFDEADLLKGGCDVPASVEQFARGIDASRHMAVEFRKIEAMRFSTNHEKSKRSDTLSDVLFCEQRKNSLWRVVRNSRSPDCRSI
jgi:hypothetical protein